MPPKAYVHTGEGPCHQICIAKPGVETWVRSWVPSGEIRGMVVRHGEALTMSEHLMVADPETGTAVYRPTVHYAYHPSDSAINSLLELRMRGWEMQPRQRILNDEIIAGRDEVGVLLMGHPYNDLLRRTRPYLGTMHSGPADWDPVSSRNDVFSDFSDERDGLNLADPWQFTNFLVR